MAPPPRWVTNAGGTVKGGERDGNSGGQVLDFCPAFENPFHLLVPNSGAKRFDDTAIGAGLDCIHDATKTRGSEQAGHEAAQGR